MPLFPATSPAPASRPSAVVVWVVLCLVLTACGSKQISPSGEGPVIAAQKDALYLPPDDGKPLTSEEIAALNSVGDFDRNIRDEDMLDVALHFKYYLHQGRRTVAKNVERAAFYLPHIRSILQQEGLPGDLAYLPFIESGYDTQARSRTGALGIWQFIRSTGDIYGMHHDWWSDERHCPYQSTAAAAEYLGKLHKQFKDWHLAITAYNAGRGRVSRALSASGTDNFFDLRRRNGLVPEKDRLSEENRQYLPRFLAACKIMRNLEALGFAAIHSANARQVSEIHVRPGTDLMSLSRRIGMSWDEFSAYNPAYLRCISPPDRSTRVFVPPHLAAEAAAFARKPDKEDAGWIKHTIRQGDTFANISGRTGVPVAELRRVNQIGEFRAGKVLRIPRSNPLRPMPSRLAANTGAAGAAPAQTGPSTGREYTVQPGDTVYGLARSWNVTTEAVMRTNNLSGSALSIGQKLVIPGAAAAGIPAAGSAQTVPKPSDKARAVTYTVRAGDTVWAIARKFDVDPAELMRANNLTRNSTIRPGDVMRMIPN